MDTHTHTPSSPTTYTQCVFLTLTSQVVLSCDVSQNGRRLCDFHLPIEQIGQIWKRQFSFTLHREPIPILKISFIVNSKTNKKQRKSKR
jgi:hypothetical protein